MDTSSKKPEDPKTLISDHPISARETVRDLENEEGVIVKLDNENHGIQTSREADGLLFPVNLPDAFHKDGLKVIFSGKLKQAGNAEFWAGQPMLLTSIEQKK